MRVIGLVDSVDHVCCRYRLRALAEGFGRGLELRALGRGLGRWQTLADVGDADVVILQRKLLASWEFSRLRRNAARLIFDFDDAVFLRDSYHPRGLISNTRLHRFAATVSTADAVVAGNEWLAKKARVAGARCVTVVPTCVDPSLYRPAGHQMKPSLTCVWIGSSSTLAGLERHRELLEAVGRAIPGLTLRLVCDRSMTLKHWGVEHWPWSAESEAHALETSDVGLSLLPDDDWSRGKCGLKVLQYLAAGLPVVGNPIGVTAEMIGEAGFVAETPEQWVAALQRLGDSERRQKLGAIGRQTVRERFSVQFGIQVWRTLLGQTTAMRQAG